MARPTGLAINGYALVTGAGMHSPLSHDLDSESYNIVAVGSGIGQETALAFAKEGAAGVAFADIDIEAAKKAADESKGHASNPEYQSIAIHIDISKKDDCDEMVDTIIENFGRLDYAANCAGVKNFM
jgi:NAD(P)-dependent dehydrogenase (short-subunit alcohol dehydrogenase family)